MRVPAAQKSNSEKRHMARIAFRWRVFLMVALIGVVAYSAWLAKWAKPLRAIPIHATER
ncbi:MAG TPA: hypothetical protein VGS41_06010 [Chthonomonadales bacterium]|nr:hypothetical protein [Chthonomonadales bacterium]